MLLGAFLPTSATADDSFLDVWVLGTGHSDAIVFSGPCGEVGLLDTGSGDAGYVLNFLDTWYDRAAVRWLAVSNYLPEHVGGIAEVGGASGIGVDAVFDRGGDRTAYDSDEYRAYYDWVTTTGIRNSVAIGDRWSLCSGSVTFTVISVGTDGTAVGGQPVIAEADKGLCVQVEYRDFDMATCGDISGVDQGSLRNVESPASQVMGQVELVKVNAHGTSTSSNSDYVSRLSPRAALIPVGANGSGLPSAEVVERWSAAGAFVAATHTDSGARTHGDIWTATDGRAFLDVSTERTFRRFDLHGEAPLRNTSSCEYVGDRDTAAYSAVFREGTWHVRDEAGGGKAHFSFRYGHAGDVAMMGDWNGDGVSTPGVFRNGWWHLKNYNCDGAADMSFKYGVATDLPIVGDWDGDGDDTVGIIRDREWHLRNDLSSGNGQIRFVYGRLTRGDLPLAGDWDGDGRDTVAIVRDGEWHFRNELAGGAADFTYVYGRVLQGDVPLVGDWNGDGIDTPGIVREADWYLRNEHAGGHHDVLYRFGRPGDVFVTRPRGGIG